MRLFSSTKIIQIDFQKFFLLNEAVHTHRRFHFPALVLPSPGSPHAPAVKRFLLHVSGCFRKIRLLHFVERDQVHVTEHPGEFLLQKFHVLRTVIFSGDQGVFKRHSSSRFFRIFSCRLQKFRKRIRPVYRHDLAAAFLLCTVQGYSQVYLREIFCKLPDARQDPAGRHCHMPVAEILAILMMEQF